MTSGSRRTSGANGSRPTTIPPMTSATASGMPCSRRAASATRTTATSRAEKSSAASICPRYPRTGRLSARFAAPGMIGRIDEAEALERAIELACRAHRGQRYPTPEPQPYVLHLFRVMVGVAGARARIAAVLHDILEDTPTSEDDLRAAGMPDDVVAAVVALTHRPEDSYEAYVEQVAGNALAREVKLADLADNLANNHALPPTPEVSARIERYERAVRRLGGKPAI